MVGYYPLPLERLISQFTKMPGIGPKSAQRLALYVLEQNSGQIKDLSAALLEVKEKVKHCSVCYNLASEDQCKVCTDPARDHTIICVVAEPKDLIAVEKTSEFKGVYHVLGGVISPLDGVGPENLRIKELLGRLKNEKVLEIVLATNPTTEGEATALYLTKLIKPLGVKITRIAYGLPVGADMDYADEVTLSRAFAGRQEM